MSLTPAIPFHLDSTGQIQQVSDDDQALSDRVRALVATVPGERLMRADYGVPTPNALFDPIVQQMVFSELQQMAGQAIRKWEPAAVITNITPVVNTDANTVAMDVRVGTATTPNAEKNRSKVVSVTIGGDILETGK
jgi:phage baseplate assembly protein W